MLAVSRAEALLDHLRRHATATEALTHWCIARFGTAQTTRVAARVQADDPVSPPEDVASLLRLCAGERLRLRRVELCWGALVVSEAENFYCPERLPRAMRTALARTDVPFGVVIASLDPRREVLVVRPGGRGVLHVEAVVRAVQALAFVREDYADVLVG